VLSEAKSLKEAVVQLDQFLFGTFVTAQASFCIVSDSPGPIRHQLRVEADAKRVKLAAHYDTFFDLQAEFSAQYPAFSPNVGLQFMADSLGLSTVGRTTRGLDACLTMADVLMRLCNDGHAFTRPVSALVPLAAAAAGAGPAGAGAAPPAAAPMAPTGFVRVRGLPWQATVADIRDFFKQGAGVAVAEVHVALNPTGRPTGEAYLKLQDPAQTDAAVAQHKKNMGSRYIEVFAATATDWEKMTSQVSDMATGAAAVMTGVGATSDPRFQGVVRMRGLPFSASREDIVAFFAPVATVASNGVLFVHGPDGRVTGDAFVEFVTEDMGARALSKHKERLGARYVELFRSSKAEMIQSAQRRAMSAASAGGGWPAAPGGHAGGAAALGGDLVVKLRGLPFNSTKMDVQQFFNAVGLVVDESAVVIGVAPDGRSAGTAWVVFNTQEELSRALTQHRALIGHRYVEVFGSSRTEMAAKSGVAVPGGGGGGMGGGAAMMSHHQHHAAAAYAAAAAGANAAYYGAAAQQAQAYSAAAAGYGAMSQPGGYGAGMYGAPAGPPGYGASAGGYDVGGGYAMMAPGAYGGGGYGGGAAAPPAYGGGAAMGYGAPAMGGGRPGKLRMRGAPFRTTVGDVMAFFAGHDIVSAEIGVNGDGRPSGEVYCTFATEAGSLRAAAEKNKNYLGDRYVDLFPMPA
jgi:RNA recognition motif-containing protein